MKKPYILLQGVIEIANKSINARTMRFPRAALTDYRIDGFLYVDGKLAFFFKVYGKAVEK